METTLPLLLAAPFVGSFLGVAIRRLPRGEGIVAGRSRCESCGVTLSPRDLVPLASFALSRGRCRQCGAPIGWFHPSIEAAALVVAVWSVLADDGALAWLDCGLGWALLTLAWIDVEAMVLPDIITLPLIPAGLAATWWLDPDSLVDHALATVAGWGLLALVAVLYRRLRGRDGLGEGDARLYAAGGAWVGLAGLGPVLLLAALAGLGFVLAIGLTGRKLAATTAIPFGAPLALGIWLVWLYAG
jgi:leader peptidase (prepilin peptidase)/N-methyltransferase